MNFLIKRKLHIAALLCVVAILVAALSISVSRNNRLVLPFAERAKPQVPSDPFANLSLEAKAAYVVDLTDKKVLFAKDAEEVLPLASLTKLVSVIVATDFLPAQTSIPITSADLTADGDTGLFPGEKWVFDALTKFSLITSSNDGITAIASVAGAQIASSTNPDLDDVFVQTMNGVMTRLGFSDMRFYNPTGLDESSTTSGGYGSARDVAGILSYLLKNHPDLIEVTGEGTTTFDSDLAVHVAANTDEALPYIPRVIASKTGYTNLAGGNLAVILDAGLMHPVALVVLGSSYDGRFSDMENLAAAATKALADKQ